MTDLDVLRPEVREAVQELDGKAYPGSRTHERWQTIRAELVRLSAFEAELAALKARISQSPIASVRTVNDSMGGITRTYVCHESQACIVLPSLDGKRVRLVVEE